MDESVRKKLRKRLRLIEGQVKGVDRMIEEGRDYDGILTQLSAIQSAARAAAVLILLERMLDHVRRSVGDTVLQCVEDCPVCHQADRLAEALSTTDYSTLLEEVARLPLRQLVTTSQISYEGGDSA